MGRENWLAVQLHQRFFTRRTTGIEAGRDFPSPLRCGDEEETVHGPMVIEWDTRGLPRGGPASSLSGFPEWVQDSNPTAFLPVIEIFGKKDAGT